MRRVRSLVIVFAVLALAGAAQAARQATALEVQWMSQSVQSPFRQSKAWARISTRDAHWGVVFIRSCATACAPVRPGAVFLLHRRSLSLHDWIGSLVASARLRPANHAQIRRVCAAAPAAVQRDLLAALCG